MDQRRARVDWGKRAKSPSPLDFASVDKCGEKKKWSGKRDSNPRPSAWKADALATELFPPQKKTYLDSSGHHAPAREGYLFRDLEGEGFEPSKAKPADLQSAPFDRSGTPPALVSVDVGLELAKGIEPPTASLQMRCSTIELRQLAGRRSTRAAPPNPLRRSVRVLSRLRQTLGACGAGTLGAER